VRSHVLHSDSRAVRQPVGHGECDAAPEAARHNQLFRRVTGPG